MAITRHNNTDDLTAQRVMEQCSQLTVGDTTAAAHQQPLTPSFVFGGAQQRGTANTIHGKKVLVYGAGDVWYKFVLAPLLHLGIQPNDITVIEKEPPPEDLKWQYEGVNIITRDKLDAQLKTDPNFIKDKGFDFAVVATPPSLHAQCAMEAIEKFKLPVMVEKPMFASTAEYDKFADFCKKKGGHVYAIDWQRALSTLLYATLGQKVPFADSIRYTKPEEFKKLEHDELEEVSARFVEGRGNALAAMGHRGHLANATLTEGNWASAGMLADMGIHPINEMTGGGFNLDKVTRAFFGGPSDDEGYRTALPHDANKGNIPEMYARVKAEMSWNGKSGIPVTIECGKGPAPNVNDGRTIFQFKSGKTLVHEFGHKTNKVTLYAPDKTTILATAIDRGEPYERMFLEANTLFDGWSQSAAGKARIAYGAESREAIRLIEESHRFACKHPSAPGTRMRQLALDEQGEQQDPGKKGEDFKIENIKEYKPISPEEVIKGSCQRHSTAEGANFDKTSGCFWYTDIEHGLLTRYDPSGGKRTTWKLTSDELDEDGRPKQMLSVVKINKKDGSVMVMLSGGGDFSGLNYFNPATAELTHIGRIPEWEKDHPENRFNDETTITIGGKNLLCYGTMSRHWDKRYDENSEYKREGAYYVLDPEDLASHQITFNEGKFPPPLITNGLADGGDTKDHKKILFWAETAEDPGKKGEQLNVYRGILDPKTFNVSGIKVFKSHEELGVTMNGVETFGRPDGAKIAKYHDRDVYGISMLELGQIRFYYSNPDDPEYKAEALRIQLPKGMTRNTQFALGEDKDGKPIGLVTTQDPGYFSRRWNVGEHNKAKDGLNGSVITFALPEGLEAHPQAISRVDYPEVEKARGFADPLPTTVELSGLAQVKKIKPYEEGRVA